VAFFVGLPSLRSGIPVWGASTISKTSGFATYFIVLNISHKQAWLIFENKKTTINRGFFIFKMSQACLCEIFKTIK
jgi:hypothetical protein